MALWMRGPRDEHSGSSFSFLHKQHFDFDDMDFIILGAQARNMRRNTRRLCGNIGNSPCISHESGPHSTSSTATERETHTPADQRRDQSSSSAAAACCWQQQRRRAGVVELSTTARQRGGSVVLMMTYRSTIVISSISFVACHKQRSSISFTPTKTHRLIRNMSEKPTNSRKRYTYSAGADDFLRNQIAPLS